MNNSKQNVISVSPEVKMAKAKRNERLAEVEFSYCPQYSVNRVEQETCRIKGHSYETIDYVPDFDHQCYKLLLQCTNCGLETFEKISEYNSVCSEYEYPTPVTLERYLNKANEASVHKRLLLTIRVNDTIGVKK